MSTYASNIPGASGYAGAALLAQKAYDNAKARYADQRRQTLLNYGYRQNAQGGYEVDPSNEYGQYQQMLRSESGQSKGLGRAQAASGWSGTSGYLGQQREDLAHAQGGEQLALGRGLQGALTDITQGEQDAAYNKDAALYQAQEEAAAKAIEAGAFNPGDYSGLNKETPYPAPVGASAKPKPAPTRRAKPSVHARGKAKLLRPKARKAAPKKGRRR